MEFDFKRGKGVWTVAHTDNRKTPPMKPRDRELQNAVAPYSSRPCEIDAMKQVTKIELQLRTKLRPVGGDLLAFGVGNKCPPPKLCRDRCFQAILNGRIGEGRVSVGIGLYLARLNGHEILLYGSKWLAAIWNGPI